MGTGKEKRDRAKELLKGTIDVEQELIWAAEAEMRIAIDAIYEEFAKHATHKI